MILHTVNKAPSNSSLAACLKVAAPDSAVLLIEDGVYAALRNAANIPDSLFQHRVYALEADVKARGLGAKLAPQIELVDYDGFVALATQYDCVQSWY